MVCNVLILPLGTIPRVPTTIGITVTFVFYNFFYSLTKSRYLFIFFFSFTFIMWSTGIVNSIRYQILFFLLTNTTSGLLTGICWSVCILGSQRILGVSFSRTNSGLYYIPFVSMTKFFSCTIPRGTPFPTTYV